MLSITRANKFYEAGLKRIELNYLKPIKSKQLKCR